jgi:Protein of unknown function (DUF2783)
MPEPRLITENRFPDPDSAFRLVVKAHRGLTEDESKALNAKLVLLLANHAGDLAVLKEALEIAKR